MILNPEYQQKLNPFRELIESYVIMQKLTGDNIDFSEYENNGIYDCWDYASPTCFTLCINRNNNAKFELSINPQDGEIIVEIKDKNINPEAHTYLKNIRSQPLRSMKENHWTRIATTVSYGGFLGYFTNKDNIVMEIMKLYFNFD